MAETVGSSLPDKEGDSSPILTFAIREFVAKRLEVRQTRLNISGRISGFASIW